MFYAHINNKASGEEKYQTLKDHSFECAIYSAASMESAGLYHLGYLAGLLHDFGKAKEEWNSYIISAASGEKVIRGSVNHTFAGVKYILETYWDQADIVRKLTAEIIGYAIGAHHGLFDIEDPNRLLDGENGFDHRINADDQDTHYLEAKLNFIKEIVSKEKIDHEFDLAAEEVKHYVVKLNSDESLSIKQREAMKGFLVRNVASAVIDGDRRSTAEFMGDQEYSILDVPKGIWLDQLEFLKNKLKTFNYESEINLVRNEISEQCDAFSESKDGIYRLSVPTGGGKTLASLRYALKHAALYQKKRIIYIIPLLTILDQNSKVIHQFIRDDNLIFEHHSDIVNYDLEKEQLDKRELYTDTWDAPIIISTLVQFLEICFSSKTSSIRRFKSLQNSVIIFDEIQSIPSKFIHLFWLMIYYLYEYCQSTIILCSATQPLFEYLSFFGAIPEIISLSNDQKRVFDRYRVNVKDISYGITLEDFGKYILDHYKENSSSLIICNTKSEVKQIYQMMEPYKGVFFDLYALTTAICRKHRQIILEQIGTVAGLNSKRPVICISTQLVEAGIDFSFEKVYRVIAGLDNIVQAAGRCNRNNEWKKKCAVDVVKLKNEELQLAKLPDIRIAQDSFQSVYVQNQEKFQSGMITDELVSDYYRILFSKLNITKKMDYRINDHYTMMQLLSTNKPCAGLDRHYLLKQAFKTAGENCKVFDDNKIDVIVPMDDVAKQTIAYLCSEKANHNPEFVKQQLDLLKPYTISLFEFEIKKLQEDLKIDNQLQSTYGILILDESAYGEFGVSIGIYKKDDSILLL